MTTESTSAFDRSVAVHQLVPGRYAGAVDPIWCGPVSPNGGVLAAAMVRAAEAELGDGAPPVRTVAAHYLEAPRSGPVELEVEVLRRGKRVAACDVRLHQTEKLACQATILFSAPRSQPIDLGREAPDMPEPDTAPEFRFERLPGAPAMFRQLEVRPTFGGIPGDRADAASTGGWIRLREDHDAPLDAARLCALCDLWWPAIFVVAGGPVPVPTIQLTVYLRAVAEAVRGYAFARFRTQLVAEGHLEEVGELWSPDGRLLAESRQLALLLPPR